MRSVYPLYFLPGIRRDLTPYFTRSYIDGLWCRWQYGMPRKMGGYLVSNGTYTSIPRGVYVATGSPYFGLYVGTSNNIYIRSLTPSGPGFGNVNDITPANFREDPNNIWSFCTMYDTASNNNVVVAVAAPNLYSIDNNVETTVYTGISSGIIPLNSTAYQCSGGVVTLGNQLFRFGNDISWSDYDNPNSEVNATRVGSGQKVVAGLQTRAGTDSPGGLFWTLDGVIRCTSSGPSPADFSFDTVSNKNSILSSRSVVQWDSQYFWAGRTRFMTYNGVVSELKNDKNRNWFYENLNLAQRQKVWAEVVSAFGEIWWHFPFGDSIECNQAVIYNVRENEWYDTMSNRGCGHYNSVYGFPVWADTLTFNNGIDNNHYAVWSHEIGYDKNINGTLTAIESNFTTGNLSFSGYGKDGSPSYAADGQVGSIDKWVDLYRVELDLLQTGKMSMVVSGSDFPRSTKVISDPYIIVDNLNLQDIHNGLYFEKIDLREQRRIMSLKFTSNVIGGFYHMGRTQISTGLGDTRQT